MRQVVQKCVCVRATVYGSFCVCWLNVHQTNNPSSSKFQRTAEGIVFFMLNTIHWLYLKGKNKLSFTAKIIPSYLDVVISLKKNIIIINLNQYNDQYFTAVVNIN